jgi:hypothetical protein
MHVFAVLNQYSPLLELSTSEREPFERAAWTVTQDSSIP